MCQFKRELQVKQRETGEFYFHAIVKSFYFSLNGATFLRNVYLWNEQLSRVRCTHEKFADSSLPMPNSFFSHAPNNATKILQKCPLQRNKQTM